MLNYTHEDILRVLPLMEENLTPLQISRLIDEISEKVMGKTNIDRMRSLSEEWTRKVSQDTKARFEHDIANAFGLDFTHILDDVNIRTAMEAENIFAANLIKSIPDEYLDQVQHAVLLNFQQKTLPEGRSLREQIQHIYGVGEVRAGIIARDQTSKMNAAFVEARNKDLGVEEYVWRTSKDQRVVGNPAGLYPKPTALHGNHHAREGKVYEWNNPPYDGHPGQAIMCRCTAEPIINLDRLRLAA